MNKLTIPAILAATVMVAGIFAFMPVEQASTVHTSGTITTTSTADITAILEDTDITIPGTITTVDTVVDGIVLDVATVDTVVDGIVLDVATVDTVVDGIVLDIVDQDFEVKCSIAGDTNAFVDAGGGGVIGSISCGAYRADGGLIDPTAGFGACSGALVFDEFSDGFTFGACTETGTTNFFTIVVTATDGFPTGNQAGFGVSVTVGSSTAVDTVSTNAL